MKLQFTTQGGKTYHFENVVRLDQVGAHTYEVYELNWSTSADGIAARRKTRVVSVAEVKVRTK